MDPCYSYNNSDSFSSSSSPFQYPQALEHNVKQPPAHNSALHSVRKFPSKNAITKKLLNAPLPPARGPKIYNVDPVDFQDVVQRLTGAEEFRTTRLKEASPPPQLSLCPPPHPGFSAEEEDDLNNPQKTSESSFGFSLSPSSYAWCSSFLTSPKPL